MDKLKKEDGNITVEAVFVFPILFFAILAFFYIAFYMSDKCKVKADLNLMAQRQAACVKTGDELGEERAYENDGKRGIFYYLNTSAGDTEKLKKETEALLKEDLAMGEVESVQVKISYTQVQISATVRLDIAVGQVKQFFTGSPLTYTMDATVAVHDPSEFARAYRAMDQVLSSSEGFQKIKEQLKLIKGIGKQSKKKE